jgi:MFS family permease
MFLAVASQVMVAVALPMIGREFGEFARLHWLILAYVVALTVSSPVYGMLGDRHGRGVMLIASLWIYVAGSLACALAVNMEMLALGRLVQGLGGGGLMSLAQALIGQLVSARETGRAQGYAASIGMAASTGGPILAGVLAEFFGWRSMFVVVILMAIAALTIVYAQKVPKITQNVRTFDTRGLVWLSASIAAFTFGIELLKSPQHWLWATCFALATVVATIGLVRSQKARLDGLFPPKLFGMSAIRRLCLLVSGHGAALVTLSTMIPLFHSITRGDSPLDIAVFVLAMTVAIGISGVITGNLVSITGRSALWPSLALPSSLLGLGLLAFAGAQLDRTGLVGAYILIGIGLGTVMPVVQTSIQFVAPDGARGSAASAVTFFRSIGAMLGTATASLVLFTWARGAGGINSDFTLMLAGPDAITPANLASWQSAFSATFAIGLIIVAGMWLAAITLPVRGIR